MSITCVHTHICYQARSRIWQISAVTNDVLDVDFVRIKCHGIKICSILILKQRDAYVCNPEMLKFC